MPARLVGPDQPAIHERQVPGLAPSRGEDFNSGTNRTSFRADWGVAFLGGDDVPRTTDTKAIRPRRNVEHEVVRCSPEYTHALRRGQGLIAFGYCRVR